MKHLSHLIQDLRFSLHMLGARPGNTLTTLVVLAVGIGMTAAMFSIIDGILFRPLDLPTGDRLVSIVDQDEGWAMNGTDYHQLARRQTSFDAVTAFQTFYTLVSPPGAPSQSYVGSYVTASLFDVLEVHPILGRRFEASDELPSAEPVAILSAGAWRRHFGQDPSVLGQTLLINGRETAVVGVLPEGVLFPYRHDIWMTLRVDMESAEKLPLFVAATLGPDTSLSTAREELLSIGKSLEPVPALDDKERDWRPVPYAFSVVDGTYKQSLSLLMAAVLVLLLVVATNVASLRLAQAAERERELAIRRALGATRWRVAALLLTETGVLVTVGALGGLLVAHLMLQSYRSLVLPSIGLNAYWLDARLDSRTLTVAIAAAGAAALLGGAGPAALSAFFRRRRAGGRAQSSSLLQRRPRREARLRRGLVVAEIALASSLLVACGLMIKSVQSLNDVDPGMESSGVLTGLMQLHHLNRDVDSTASRRRFYSRLLQGLRSRTEIDAAALGSAIPGAQRSGFTSVRSFARGARARAASPRRRFVRQRELLRDPSHARRSWQRPSRIGRCARVARRSASHRRQSLVRAPAPSELRAAG